MTKRVPFNSQLPVELNAAIGAFITTWSNTSALLTMLISNLAAGKTLGPEDDMVFAFAHVGMDVRVQLGLIRTMGAARLGRKHEKEIGKLCDRLENSKGQRDKLAHAPWRLSDKGESLIHSIKTVGKVKLTLDVVTVESVKEETQKLIESVADLLALVQRFGFLADYELSSQV